LPEKNSEPLPDDTGCSTPGPPIGEWGDPADKHKPTVVALREMSMGKVGIEVLAKSQA
jgi:hypothetical protein